MTPRLALCALAVVASIPLATLAADIVLTPPAGGAVAITGGNLTLDPSSASAGNIMKGASRFIHNFGTGNTFVGVSAGNFLMSGTGNTAIGNQAMFANNTGYANTVSGTQALLQNSSGYSNTVSGYLAMYSNTTGHDNIAIGVAAGYLYTTGNYNIAIGHTGIAAETGTTRIGMPTQQTRTFVAGIRGVATGVGDAVAVLIDSAGQLGTSNSARRFKEDIADMDEASAALMKLRPVTFHYKSDANTSTRRLQYGLVAEEVAAVYPGLVAHSADGEVETVMYQYLPAMLLNEYQKQQRTIQAQVDRIAELEKQAEEIAILKAKTEWLVKALDGLTANATIRAAAVDRH